MKRQIRRRPLAFSALLSILGYSVVVGVLLFPTSLGFPQIGTESVDLITNTIAVVNSAAVVSLASGWYLIRRRIIKWHRRSMITAFTLILVFLFLYIVKIGGAGGTKVLVPPEGQEWVKSFIYLPMLSVHLVLSVVSVPAVVYAITLGLTHRPAELARMNKAKVGRIAVYAWITSLVLGVLTYMMLQIYPTTISQGALTLPQLFRS